MRHLPLVVLLVSTLVLPACGVAPTRVPAGAMARTGVKAIAKSDAAAPDFAVLRDVGDRAKATLKEMEATYAELKLDTAAGRKITPKNEPMLRTGLSALITKLDARLGEFVAQLESDGRHEDLVRDLTQRRPALGDAMPADATASDMLYRVAQFRLKLGALVEYAVRKGVVTE